MTIEINFRGVDLVVEGIYDEGEAGQMYFSDMSGIPPSPSGFEIESLKVWDSEEDLYELFSYDMLNELQDLIIEQIEN